MVVLSLEGGEGSEVDIVAGDSEGEDGGWGPMDNGKVLVHIRDAELEGG